MAADSLLIAEAEAQSPHSDIAGSIPRYNGTGDSRRILPVPPDPPESFGVAQAAPNFFVSDPSHVRSRLAVMLAAMRAAKRWPWEQVMVELYRETVWPYLYTRLADQDEADRWRGDIEAEIARLDDAA